MGSRVEKSPRQPRGVPPGHFYSPIADIKGVWANEERIFAIPSAGRDQRQLQV